MATKTAREFVSVNGEEVLLTNAVALTFAVDALRKVDADPRVIAKVQKHLETLSKKSSTAGAPTKAQVENAAYAKKLLEIMPSEPVSLEWVAGKFGFIATDGRGNKQKALQVVKLLVADDKVTKIDGRPVTYQRI